MMIEKIKKPGKLLKFLKNGRSREIVKFDEDIWREGIETLAELNNPDYFFEFEDRIIHEIVVLASKLPKSKAKVEIQKVEKIMKEDFEVSPHAKSLFQSLKYSILGAVSVALNCLA
ncbi:MAG: hypothetical protein NT030_00520 [Candidatus Saganbacteria bacterium]|nr:hypothetical protein [Candidatus Saganbacteria bacterium]